MVGLSTVCLGTVFYVFEIHLQSSSALAGEGDSLFIFKALHLCDHFVIVNLNHENFHSAKFLLRRYEYFCILLSKKVLLM